MISNTKQAPQLPQMAVISWFLSLQFIFRPSYWSMNYPYSKDVDEIILELLNNNDFESYRTEAKGTAYLGNTLIWVGNKPYASITLYETCLENYRPSRLTILKALNKLKKLEKKEKAKDKIKFLECVSSFKRNIGLN